MPGEDGETVSAPPAGEQPSTSAPAAPAGKKYPQLQMPSYEQMMQQDMMDNCAVKSIISGVMGGALGVAFGIFTASLDASGGSLEPISVEETKPTRQIIKEQFVHMKNKSVSYAKGFAAMGLLYSGVECLVEKQRAKHDKLNATYAGCITGGMLAYSGGAKAMCLGCASFAAFSTAIEYIMD